MRAIIGHVTCAMEKRVKSGERKRGEYQLAYRIKRIRASNIINDNIL